MNKETIKEFKQRLIGLLLPGEYKRVSSTQYRMRECPKCGDMKFHLYIKIDVNTDEPVLYNCFKCNSGGIVTESFLKQLGYNIDVPTFNYGKKLNMNSNMSSKIPSILVDETNNIDTIVSYVNDRVGHVPTLCELQYFHYIGNPHKYANDFLGNEGSLTINNRVWFQMTNGNMIGRSIKDNDNMRWLKYKTTKARGVGLYKIAMPVDLYQPIHVIIAEGVMDVIGLFYNYKETFNNIYIGTMGKDYCKGIKYILDKGLFGESVYIKIFKDPDVPLNKIWVDEELRSLFKKVDIFENCSGYDYGVKPELLDIHKVVK